MVRSEPASRAFRAEPEHDLQVQVAAFLEVALVGVAAWTSIDAGAGRMGKRAAGRRKARGVKTGWPDILVVHGAPGVVRRLLGIELKAGRGRPSDEQKAVRAAFEAQGGVYEVARSLLEVDAILVRHGLPLRYRVSICGNRWFYAGGAAA